MERVGLAYTLASLSGNPPVWFHLSGEHLGSASEDARDDPKKIQQGGKGSYGGLCLCVKSLIALSTLIDPIEGTLGRRWWWLGVAIKVLGLRTPKSNKCVDVPCLMP